MSGVPTSMTYRYRPEVLAQLAVHGVVPRDTTRPELVREFVNDLYRYELRRLRDRLLRHEFPKSQYLGLVAQMRNRYAVLSRRIWEWTQ